MATAAAGVVAALGLGAYSAVAATPSHHRSTAHKVTVSEYGVLIGPLTAKDGFKVEIQAVGCGTKNGIVLVNYEKGDGTIALDHSYVKAGGTCRVSKTLEAATLKVHWGTALNLDLKLATTRKLSKVRSDVCKNSYDEYRVAKTTGTGVLAIHGTAFGTLRVRRDAAKVVALVSSGKCTVSGSTGGTTGGVMPINGSTGGFLRARGRSALGRAASSATDRARTLARALAPASRPADTTTTTTPSTTVPTTTTTPATTPTPGTTTTPTSPPTITPDGSGSQFFGVFGADERLVLSAETDAPDKPLVIINDYTTDSPAPGVQGAMDVGAASTNAFTVASGDTGAQISVAAPFARGSLAFTPTGLCHSSTDALDGTLVGKIVVTDPVFGTLTLNGPTAVGAALGNGDANLTNC